ncbi:AraC family transcriptional regulator [Cupriavidus respiraculi]|nr:AraC family transcriptional regulator [Cupriavidus respiraculi]
MDPLSEICATIHVRDALFARVEASAPWGVKSAGEPGFKFVLLLKGSCILKMQGAPAPMVLNAGDVFITLDATPYEIYDSAGSSLLDCERLLASMVGNTIAIGGHGPSATFLSGIFELDAVDAVPLLAALPPFLLMRAGEESHAAFEAVLGMLARESTTRQLGANAMIARLFEILFIHAVRAHCEQQPVAVNGWLGVMTDPQLSKAGNAMHDDLGREWTLEMLAQEAGMSRTSFAARFKQRANQTPLDYLTRWRMHKAAHLIRRGSQSLAQIARTVGYQSEAAFNRSFAREIGMTPGKYRKASPPSPEVAGK